MYANWNEAQWTSHSNIRSHTYKWHRERKRYRDGERERVCGCGYIWIKDSHRASHRGVLFACDFEYLDG